MHSLPSRIMEHAEALPEATPLCPGSLLHLGKRAAIDQALAWLGPEEVEDGLDAVLPSLSAEDLDELSAARAVMPAWMADPLSARLVHG